MPDKFSKEVRSKIMSRIRSKNTSPEIELRKLLWSKGFRYRIHYQIKGDEKVVRPDITFVSKKIAIFVDGCFWHKCPECYVEPKSNVEFWRKKIKRNVARDEKDSRILKDSGWNVIRIWEHELKRDIDKVVEMIVQELSTLSRGKQIQ